MKAGPLWKLRTCCWLQFYCLNIQVKMKAGPLCFSVLQHERRRVSSLLKRSPFLKPRTQAGFWSENFNTLRGRVGNICSFYLNGSGTHGPSVRGYYSGKWKQHYMTMKIGGNESTQSIKLYSFKHEVFDRKVTVGTKFTINKSENGESERVEYCDIQQKIADSRVLDQHVTFFVFDIETTGLSRKNERIIEIAIQDLLGGKNSTFQTLVNPERVVLNSHVHGITTSMVNRPDVPRMGDLIPILKEYVKSRQKPGGIIVWAAHNARSFDVPFLIKEFSRCSIEIPPDWVFLDTLPLARLLMKPDGSKLDSISQQSLREYYGIPMVGSAHRAMSDVQTLSRILQKMTFDLKMPIVSLVERCFKASDLINTKKSVT
ncbi:PREDICTED: exonuclease DPD1, chloroplastic/mitochondrial-like isoform X2 [Nelumbo nucifera]|nr:PREDICTED: exonuclease DPD1, chloroplastic/mitochondrial-like isoform X2 [Nelumbo nucifera]XP_010259418.1 PREDICTED: exonuclease DPD1, chloroplastic/mitochondrial-like isoform X2 [Nelumbo nucifera]DAD38176.1 TPA_asm: hypothetical protein HUJ06_008817 [Nelumbo nucifera]